MPSVLHIIDAKTREDGGNGEIQSTVKSRLSFAPNMSGYKTCLGANLSKAAPVYREPVQSGVVVARLKA
jgi:hypothetical protein